MEQLTIGIFLLIAHMVGLHADITNLIFIAISGIYLAEAQHSELKWISKRKNSTSEKTAI